MCLSTKPPEKVLEIVQNWKSGCGSIAWLRNSRILQANSGFRNYRIFKAFSVDESFDFSSLNAYSGVCDYFLFDTKGQLPGGTGQKFNWQLLENYNGDVPFFLSGGIGPDDLEAVLSFRHPQLFGIDINSGFEISPALKDIEKVKIFISGIRKFNNK